jgi:glutamyl-tRNA reductase
MNLFCVGLSHHTAEVQVRERFAMQTTIDRVLREEAGCREGVLLTTCNRVEIYAVSEKVIPTAEVVQCLCGHGIEPLEEEVGAFYRYEAWRCVQHLFRVVSGLDSMVIGETEILGQAKKAYEAARSSGSVGPFLHRLFQRAFRVAKQVRTMTGITRGSVSVGSVAVDLAEKIFGDFESRKVLLLGAGEASERTARALVKRGVSDIRVTNRSWERAQALAGLISGSAVRLHEWERHFREVDIVISSTASQKPVLTRERLEPLISDRLDRPLFIIDIAVPRDVAPEVQEMEGIFLYDIDSLRSIAQQSLAFRREEMTAAENIIDEHVNDFSGWFTAARERSLGGTSLRPSES